MNKTIFKRLKDQALQQRSEKPFERIEKLQRVEKWIQDNENLILEALQKDFKKPAFETQVSEILPILSDLRFFKKNLKKWMKPQSVSTPLALFGHKSQIHYDNKGVVLIIAPWNYPFQLAMAPLVASIGAGNTAVIKPSEMTEATADVILKLVNSCFTADEVVVELGAKEKTEELLCYDFDHVFFTGSTAVGRIIAKSCAERLIPFTLELGGKSPTIVDETADITDASEKIFWGKFLNRGQTCIAPDYVLVQSNVRKELEERLNDLIKKHADDQKSSVINDRHQQRLQVLSQSQSNIQETVLTLVKDAKSDSALMKEEIFGPVLPLISYTQESEIYSWVNQNSSPLSLYVFSNNKGFIDRALANIPSGGCWHQHGTGSFCQSSFTIWRRGFKWFRKIPWLSRVLRIFASARGDHAKLFAANEVLSTTTLHSNKIQTD
jgi:aldehyde dehydrogenase (NAD+)